MSDSHDEEEHTIAEDIVVTKYKMASDMINGILKKLVERCVPGAIIVDICEYGDQLLKDELAKVYKKEKEMKKGIAFPTSLSVNNCICHNSPLKSDAPVELKAGDLVKLDLGAHIDGYAAMVAHSLVLGATPQTPATGRAADVMLAAHNAAEACLRLFKPGADNITASRTVQKIAQAYNCNSVEGMQCHLLRRGAVESEKAVVWNPTDELRKSVDKCEFDVHEVWNVDVLVSTGEGRPKERDVKTTIYRKKDLVYNLKMKASRNFFTELQHKSQSYPINLRSFEDEKRARMGVVECVKHELVEPLPVYFEKDAELVAQFKFTLLLMPNGPMRITGLDFDAAAYKSEFVIEDEEIKTMLATATSSKAGKKKRKKKAAEQMREDVVAAAAAPES